MNNEVKLISGPMVMLALSTSALVGLPSLQAHDAPPLPSGNPYNRAELRSREVHIANRSSDDRDGGSDPITLLETIILAPLAAMLIQAAISRSREFAADRGGAEIAGTPNGLASALRHIEAAAKQIPLNANPATAHMFIMQPFTGGGLMNMFSSHPPTEARIKALLGQQYVG